MRAAFTRVALAVSFVLAMAVAQRAIADEFYKGKSITLVIGYAPGGGYDTNARLVARFLSKHVPGNPTIVPNNMPGSGGLTATLYLYAVAPKDGSVIGLVNRSYAIEPILYPDTAKYDPKRFNPIGSSSSEVSIGAVWHSAPVNTLTDLKSTEVAMGATSATDDTGRFPIILRKLVGARVKVVTGYPGGNNILKAMESGEVHGRVGWSWDSIKSRSRPWLQEKKVRLIVQMALEKAKDLPDVPNIMEFAKSDLDRRALELIFTPQAAAWPIIAPPDVPRDRVTLLRRAFDRMLADQELLAEARKIQIDINPVAGEAMDKLVERTTGFDRKVIDHAVFLTKAE